MNIYAPSDNPVVLVVGTDDQTSRIRSLLTRFLGAVGALAVLSLVVHSLVEGFPFTGLTAAGNQPDPVGWSTGVAFFIGGFVVLVAAFWWQTFRQ